MTIKGHHHKLHHLSQSFVRFLLFDCNKYKIKVITSIITPRKKKLKGRGGGGGLGFFYFWKIKNTKRRQCKGECERGEGKNGRKQTPSPLLFVFEFI